ncbi:uncharacterized protein LOC141914717 [Tubulanus polymorphus]|uniref:uncharacterized protein LOC141914717 n=1 Tax=Tubulanus polymorphus TaxID=672921 RepID=UPI003DA2E83B
MTMALSNFSASDVDADLRRPKRLPVKRSTIFQADFTNNETLDLDGIVKLLQAYGNYDVGGINCRICGKLYKSKVCYVKHLWEHSIYWKSFEGETNHTRVLSIQAALILYNRNNNCHHTSNPIDHDLLNLLVTAPQDKKKDSQEFHQHQLHSRNLRKSPYKRKKSSSLSEPDMRSS